MNRADALDAVTRLEVAYREELTDPERNLWLEKLSPMPAEPVVRAVEARINSPERFMPRIGEILSAVAEGLDDAPSFALAWAEMESLASAGDYFHPNVPPAFSHPAITRLAEAIGWQHFTDSTVGDTYFSHMAEKVYAGVLEHRRSLVLEAPERAAELLAGGDVPDDIRELVSGIGGEDAE